MKNLKVGGSRNYQVVAFSKGEIFFAKYMQPDNIGTFAEQDSENREKLTFTSEAIAVVEGLHASGRGCKHMRFVRNDRKTDGAQGLGFVQIKHWPKLRVALNHAGVERAHAQGGFENALAYRDEIVVPDYSVSGSSGWIIPKKDVGRYLDALPPLPKDNGKLLHFFVEDTGSGSPDTYRVEVYDKGYYPKATLTYYDRPAGYHQSYSVRSLHEVIFDEGSGKVKKIVHVPTGEERKSETISYKPGIQTSQTAEVGKRLPDWARECGKPLDFVPQPHIDEGSLFAGNVPAEFSLPTPECWESVVRYWGGEEITHPSGGHTLSVTANVVIQREMPATWQEIHRVLQKAERDYSEQLREQYPDDDDRRYRCLDTFPHRSYVWLAQSARIEIE